MWATRYRAIADDLRNAIAAGDYPPGSRLPGENTIIVTYGVARETARKALRQLVNDGIAEARQGSGTYVVERKAMSDNVNDLDLNAIKANLASLNEIMAEVVRALPDADAAWRGVVTRLLKNHSWSLGFEFQGQWNEPDSEFMDFIARRGVGGSSLGG